MFKKVFFVALFVVNFTSGFNAISQNEDKEAGAPGAAQIFLNVNAMQALLRVITGFVPYYDLIGKSWTPDLDIQLAGIDFKLHQVNITEFEIAPSFFEFVGDTDTVRTIIPNANISLAVDAKATSFVPVPLEITEVNITNFNLQLDLGTTSEDQLIWQMQESLLLSVENVTMSVKEEFWQKHLVDKLQPAAMKAITYGLKFFQGVTTGVVEEFNEVLKNETETTFEFNATSILGSEQEMLFNLTMSKAPEFSNEKGEILLHIDSNFDSTDKRDYVPENISWMNFTSVPQGEQLWIHQSLINTALYNFKKTIGGYGFNYQIFLLMEELQGYYGPDCDCEGVLTIPNESDAQPITISKEKGVIIGNEDHGLRVNVGIKCARNSTLEKELAVELDTGLHLVANFTFDDFRFWATLNDAKIMQTTAESKVEGLVMNYHAWDKLLTAVVHGMTDDFNIRFGWEHDLRETHPKINLITHILQKTVLSPFVADEFILAGFKTGQN